MTPTVPLAHADRRARAQGKIAALGADAALITSLVNVRYLTGLVSSNAALLLPVHGPAVLATDFRYEQTARREAPELELVIDRFIEPALTRLAGARGLRAVAFEAHVMTVEQYQELTQVNGAPSLAAAGRIIEELRMVKDEAEIALLARACAITSEALSAALPGRPFAAGDLITIDCGARYGGYHADMTRTVALGAPAAWQRDIYDLVSEAQRAGIQAATVGTDVSAVDAAARDLIAAAGHGGHFRHGLGHGVGLEVHEAPTIGYGKTGTLVDRVPVTVEPGIYLPGRGGVRIEDTLVVRAGAGAAGSPEMLTTTTRELLVL